MADIKQSLKQLKELFQEELITKEVYGDRQNTLLDQLDIIKQGEFFPLMNLFDKADFKELFQLNNDVLICSQMKMLIDQLYQVAIIKQELKQNVVLTHVLKGAGGVGKTTTLYTNTIAYTTQKAGCLVMYINAKHFTDGTEWINMKVCEFMAKWLGYTPNIDMLKKFRFSTSSMSLYDIAHIAANNPDQSVLAFQKFISALKLITVVPVIFCVVHS
ncbi:958_t:CDS:2 [Paraglomus brasilianum]|uniref:958_t:CDS:1 n=1 Tax=Paraglomus brasilianum TaxID=144538 RepID=A0A9N9H1J0_9GLOM|nr:958_t:CDS:2 [Paraglomus brasilianum]